MESKVLVIYTGGTIGMLTGAHGFVPEPAFLTQTLRRCVEDFLISLRKGALSATGPARVGEFEPSHDRFRSPRDLCHRRPIGWHYD